MEPKTFDGEQPPNALAETVKKLKTDLPATIEYVLVTAKLTKIKYDSLINEGFTPTQALELSKRVF